jgi:hypothetical protein
MCLASILVYLMCNKGIIMEGKMMRASSPVFYFDWSLFIVFTIVILVQYSKLSKVYYDCSLSARCPCTLTDKGQQMSVSRV